MPDNTNAQSLRSCPLAAELNDNQCSLLMGCFDEHSLEDGVSLIKEGEHDNRLFVVMEGLLAVTKKAGNDSVTLHILQPGDMAGALGFIDGEAHSATLQSVGTTRVLSLERSQLEGLLTQDPMLVYQVMRAITRSMHRILRRMNLQHVELTNYIAKHQGA
jgi:CRP-like cAMP-binding protein